MKLSTKAMFFATKKHENQYDDEGKHYFFHPMKVAEILKLITEDDNLIAAAYLHDTLEDTDTTYEELVEKFNQDIADLVVEVTKAKNEKGEKIFPNLKTQRGMILKFADRLHNISRMESWSEEKKEKYLQSSIFWKKE